MFNLSKSVLSCTYYKTVKIKLSITWPTAGVKHEPIKGFSGKGFGGCSDGLTVLAVLLLTQQFAAEPLQAAVALLQLSLDLLQSLLDLLLVSYSGLHVHAALLQLPDFTLVCGGGSELNKLQTFAKTQTCKRKSDNVSQQVLWAVRGSHVVLSDQPELSQWALGFFWALEWVCLSLHTANCALSGGLWGCRTMKTRLQSKWDLKMNSSPEAAYSFQTDILTQSSLIPNKVLWFLFFVFFKYCNIKLYRSLSFSVCIQACSIFCRAALLMTKPVK